MLEVDRYRINDALTALAHEFGVTLPDEALNDLTHTVADAFDNNFLVTCDGCSNVSDEGGWGDTPFCLDCHYKGKATEGSVCLKHGRTYYGTCPLCDPISDEQATEDRLTVRLSGDMG